MTAHLPVHDIALCSRDVRVHVWTRIWFFFVHCMSAIWFLNTASSLFGDVFNVVMIV